MVIGDHSCVRSWLWLEVPNLASEFCRVAQSNDGIMVLVGEPEQNTCGLKSGTF